MHVCTTKGFFPPCSAILYCGEEQTQKAAFSDYMISMYWNVDYVFAVTLCIGGDKRLRPVYLGMRAIVVSCCMIPFV